MAENQYYPALGGLLETGSELQLDDVVALGKVAGLADDRVFAEFLRLPFSGAFGTVAKAILPYTINAPFLAGIRSPTFSPGAGNATVQPSGSTDAKIIINPFRAIVGSRTPPATDAVAAWRDIRSGIFTGGTTQLTQETPLTVPNPTNPRWDLVYAQISVDTTSAPTISRRVKDPNASTVSVQSLTLNLVQQVRVLVVTGTASATPVIPALPADSATVFNIPLAAIRVIAGFTATTAILPGDIRTLAPVLPMTVGGMSTLAPGNGNNDGAVPAGGVGSYQQFQPWDMTTGGQRPEVFLPPSMVGGVSRFFLLNFIDPTFPSLASLAIADNSIDWRNRFFKCVVSASGISPFASAPGLGGFSPSTTDALLTFTANSCDYGTTSGTTYTAIANTQELIRCDHTTLPTMMPPGAKACLYVGSADGILRAFFTGVPAVRLFVWIDATAQFPNI